MFDPPELFECNERAEFMGETSGRVLTCGNGHESEWDDYCSVCGEAIGSVAAPVANATEAGEAVEGGAAARPPAAEGPTCDNCGESYAEGDVFCEACGYDFLSGTLPGDDGAAPPPASGVPKDVAIATVEVDLEFFERMAFTGVDAPEDLPEPVQIELPPTDILIGRHSESRGTFPEIDLSKVFGEESPATDPAVSSSHCRLHRSSNGWTITDLDSTNGTYLDGATDPLAPGTPMSLIPGTPFHVGAWTKITITV